MRRSLRGIKSPGRGVSNPLDFEWHLRRIAVVRVPCVAHVRYLETNRQADIAGKKAEDTPRLYMTLRRFYLLSDASPSPSSLPLLSTSATTSRSPNCSLRAPLPSRRHPTHCLLPPKLQKCSRARTAPRKIHLNKGRGRSPLQSHYGLTQNTSPLFDSSSAPSQP